MRSQDPPAGRRVRKGCSGEGRPYSHVTTQCLLLGPLRKTLCQVPCPSPPSGTTPSPGTSPPPSLWPLAHAQVSGRSRAAAWAQSCQASKQKEKASPDAFSIGLLPSSTHPAAFARSQSSDGTEGPGTLLSLRHQAPQSQGGSRPFQRCSGLLVLPPPHPRLLQKQSEGRLVGRRVRPDSDLPLKPTRNDSPLCTPVPPLICSAAQMAVRLFTGTRGTQKSGPRCFLFLSPYLGRHALTTLASSSHAQRWSGDRVHSARWTFGALGSGASLPSRQSASL